MLTTDEALERAAAATVQLPGGPGLGVLVPGGFILTAAHCVEHHECMASRIALGDEITEHVKPRWSGKLSFDVAVFEAGSDIAMLMPGDPEKHHSQEAALDEFYTDVAPVPVCNDGLTLMESFDVHIRTHDGGWATGKAQLCRKHAPSLFIRSNQPIKGGASGGPIIDSKTGKLVGITSMFADGGDGQAPRPHLALPVWAWKKIEEAQNAQDAADRREKPWAHPRWVQIPPTVVVDPREEG